MRLIRIQILGPCPLPTIHAWEFIKIDVFLCHVLQPTSIGEKQDAERLFYSQENRRNNKLTLNDISLDKFYRFGPFQR
jgi:hypothetical protein